MNLSTTALWRGYTAMIASRLAPGSFPDDHRFHETSPVLNVPPTGAGPPFPCSDMECFRVPADPLFQAAGRLPSDARDRVGHHGRVALAGVGVQLDECGRLPFALPCAEEPRLELL